MLKDWFDVVDRSIQEEGGYSNDPKDPGGETQWGISKRAFPDEDIKSLTRAEAVRLYYNYYWQGPKIASLPLELAFQVFDAGINIGTADAVRILQSVVGVPADGQVGPQTLAAVAALPRAVVILGFLAGRQGHYLNSAHWDSYGKGWTARVAQCAKWAAEDLRVGPLTPSTRGLIP